MPGKGDVRVGHGKTRGTINAQVLTADEVANVAASNATGGIPVLFVVPVAGGEAGDADVTMAHKVRVVDAWAVHTGGAGEESDTLQVKNGTSAITDAMSWAGADNTVVRAASIDDSKHEIAAGGTLRVTTTDSDEGDDVGAGLVYVLAVRVA